MVVRYQLYYTRLLFETNNFGKMQLEASLYSKALCNHFLVFCQVKFEEIIFIEVFVTRFLALSFTELGDPKCLAELLNLSSEHSEVQPP